MLKKKTQMLLSGALGIVLFLLSATGAQAQNFEFDNNVTLDWDTTLRYSTAWRLQSQDKELLADVNSDDGNRNFDKGFINNRLDLITEADLAYKEFGTFVRFRAYYDDIYANTNDNNSPSTSNNVSKPPNKFTDDTQKDMGKNYEFMDYFIYGGFDVAGRAVNVRIGNQVIGWGESLFIVGGVASGQGPMDAVSANLPGVELKELFIPVGQVYVQSDLTDSVSIGVYYQWEWDKTRLDPAGSYFSTGDMIDEGGESLILGPGLAARRVNDLEAKDSGQWGVSLNYVAEALNSTDFGIYYINYHDKTPQFNMGGFTDISDMLGQTPGTTIVPTEYYLSYVEDIRLFGVSFGTVLGSTNVGGEFTYRDNQPVSLAAGGFKQVPVIQGQVSVVHLFGSNPLMDNLNLTAEAAFNRVHTLESKEIANDKFAWGFTAQLTPTWYSVLPALDLNLPITVSHGVKGNSSMGGTFAEDKGKLGISMNFTYLNKYKVSLAYANFYGGTKNNLIDDRDLVSLSFKYTF